MFTQKKMKDVNNFDYIRLKNNNFQTKYFVSGKILICNSENLNENEI